MWLCVAGIFVPLIVLSRTQALLGLDEGDTCKKATDASWTCTTLKKCAHIDVRILRPSICTFRGREPIICCPPKKMSKAEMSCLNSTPLCNKFNMFRSAEASAKWPSNLDWTEFGDTSVIEIPSGSELILNHTNLTTIEISTMPNEVPSTTAETPHRLSSADMSEKLESNFLATPSIGQLPNTANMTELPPPKVKQFVVGGQLSLPRIHRHMVHLQ